MELGSLLKQARLGAGLSQRQLCGQEITRNMLSQIENGSARPSMDTLRYLASRLGKPMSYFLQEDSPSPNQAVMAKARDAYVSGAYTDAMDFLKDYQMPDAAFDSEKGLLHTLCLLALAEQAVAEDRLPYARKLLEDAQRIGQTTPYYTKDLQRRRLLLLAEADPDSCGMIAGELPDGELLLRARAALKGENYAQCAALLDACAEQESKQWSILRGDAAFGLGEYEQAARYYMQAEEMCYKQLEMCYERMENYKLAYYYACKQR